MIRQYRIEHFNGIEMLVCEVYDRYLWSQEQYAAFKVWFDEHRKDFDNPPTYSDFRVLLNEWCDKEHEPGEKFYGLDTPIPAVSPLPCIVLRGAIQSNRLFHLETDFQQSVTTLLLLDSIERFVRFLDNPHWRNTVAHQVEQYGSLFASDND